MSGKAPAICLWLANRGPRKRYLHVTEHRTKRDFALFIRDLVDVYYPTAEQIVLVMDNLNTHTLAALYEVFEPAEARRLIEKLELHYTPKHGSWVNMAEIEFSVLTRQCLDRRIGSRTELEQEVAAWQTKRNGQAVGINWRFTTADARIKLKHLYPSLAYRDDARVGQALYAGAEIEEMHELSEVGLLDEFFVFVEQVGMMAVLE